MDFDLAPTYQWTFLFRAGLLTVSYTGRWGIGSGRDSKEAFFDRGLAIFRSAGSGFLGDLSFPVFADLSFCVFVEGVFAVFVVESDRFRLPSNVFLSGMMALTFFEAGEFCFCRTLNAHNFSYQSFRRGFSRRLFPSSDNCCLDHFSILDLRLHFLRGDFRNFAVHNSFDFGNDGFTDLSFFIGLQVEFGRGRSCLPLTNETPTILCSAITFLFLGALKPYEIVV